jgi:integrase
MILKPKEKTKLDLLIERYLGSIGANDNDNIDTIYEWFDVIGKVEGEGAKERTQLSYIRTLVEFCKFIEMTPAEFIKECKYEKINVPDIDDRKIKKYFIRYKRAISDNASKTIQRKIATIKSFCQTRNIELPYNEKKTKNAYPKDENKHIPTREDIKEALQFANIRNKAIILLQASSGLSSIDVRNIPVRMVKEGLNENDNIITFDWVRIKTGVDHVTFCSPEATEAIKAYMEYRNRPPFAKTQEKINQYEKRRIRSDDDFLFINSKISDEYLVNFDENYRFISDQEIQHAYRLIEKSCEKQAPKGTHSFIRSHNMRKFFANTVKNHLSDFVTLETFMGHKVQGSISHYTEADIQNLKEQYMKVLPHLMFLEDIEVKTLETYDYRLNQANIEIMNIQSAAMMELYPYVYRIKEDSKEIERRQRTIDRLKELDAEKFQKQIDSQYEKIDELISDRDVNEGELNYKKTEYQKQIDAVNLKYNVQIKATLDKLKYDYQKDEKEKMKELN